MSDDVVRQARLVLRRYREKKAAERVKLEIDMKLEIAAKELERRLALHGGDS